MNLTDYDHIVINTSAGKDSQAMTEVVCRMAREQDVVDRVVMVHADLGRAEWPGCPELAAYHAAFKGVPLIVVQRKQWLLDHIHERGMFPDNRNRYCTSDHKRSQVYKVFTQLVARHDRTEHPIRILNCMGMRAQESPARAKRVPFQRDQMASNGKRWVDTWLPLHSWKVEQVWEEIHRGGMPYHYAYDLGLPRISCIFCIFAPPDALRLAGYYNRNLLLEYVAVEKEIQHTFRHKQSLASILADLDRGYEPRAAGDWAM